MPPDGPGGGYKHECIQKTYWRHATERTRWWRRLLLINVTKECTGGIPPDGPGGAGGG